MAMPVTITVVYFWWIRPRAFNRLSLEVQWGVFWRSYSRRYSFRSGRIEVLLLREATARPERVRDPRSR
jgi:hypothetical protein